MYCMRVVAELSKSANFGGGDYNFSTKCMMWSGVCNVLYCTNFSSQFSLKVVY
jgi:hypothetical protein